MVVIGGSIGLNKMTKINYHISQIKSAEELAAVTASVGATPAEVPLVVAQLKQRSHVDQALAKEILSTIRKDQVND